MEERPPNQAKDDEKKDLLGKVTTGEVIQQKPSLGKRIKKLIIGGDARSVVGYIFEEILLPAFKDTLADMVSQGAERMIFGEARSTSRRTGTRPGGGSGNGYVSYNRYSSSTPWKQEREERREPSRRARANHDFREIILATRVEANEVVDRMFELVSRYNRATVADLYSLLGITAQFTDEKWGWEDLRGTGIVRVSNGYLLDIAPPEPLD